MTANSYWTTSFTVAFATIPALAGASLLYGQIGLISLCQFALAGVGGWVALRVYDAFHPPFEISVLAGAVAASLIGILWGLPALKLRGLYLAMATLMFAGTFQTVISIWNFPIGGSGFLATAGANGVAEVLIGRPALATSGERYFVWVGLVALISLLVVEAHRYAKPGRAWALLRRDERMAIASGVRPVFYKAWGFALAGLLAGTSGALLAGTYGQLDSSAFNSQESIMLFVASVLGGTTNWVGTVLGSLLLRLVPGFFNDIGVSATVSSLLFGVGLIHAITSTSGGIAGSVDRFLDRFFD